MRLRDGLSSDASTKNSCAQKSCPPECSATGATSHIETGRRIDGTCGGGRAVSPPAGLSGTVCVASDAHAGRDLGRRGRLSRARNGTVRGERAERENVEQMRRVVDSQCEGKPARGGSAGDAEGNRGNTGRSGGTGRGRVRAHSGKRQRQAGNTLPDAKAKKSGWRRETAAARAGQPCRAVAGKLQTIFAAGAFETAVGGRH